MGLLNCFSDELEDPIHLALTEDIFDLKIDTPAKVSKFAGLIYLEKVYDRDYKQSISKGAIDPIMLEKMNIYHSLRINHTDLEEFNRRLDIMLDVDLCDGTGRTMLHALCLYGELQTVKLLVNKYKCDVNICDYKGFNALHLCAITDKVDIAVFLINKGCLDRGAGDHMSGRYPVHLAAMCGSINVFKLMIGYRISGEKAEAGNMYNLKRKDGGGKNARTPLWLSTYYNNGSIASLIIAILAGTDFDEFSEKELSFVYRMGTRIPHITRELLDSFLVKNPERRTEFFWVEDWMLGNVYWQSVDSMDSGVQLMTTIGTEAPLMKVIDHPYFWNILLIKWKVYGRTCSIIYSLLKWLYIILWTAIYCLDSTYVAIKVHVKLKDTAFYQSVKDINVSVTTILIIIFAFPSLVIMFDIIKMVSSIMMINRFASHEKDVLNFEKNIVQGTAMLAPQCTLAAEQLRLKKPKRCLGAYSGFEYVVDIASILMLIYYTILLLNDGDNRVKDGVYNQPRDYVCSCLLILLYCVGLGTLRFFEYFAYLVEVLKKVFEDVLKMSFIFLCLYIPITCVYWETIYSWDQASNVSVTTGTNGTVNGWYTAVETIRKTHMNYDYDLGKELAQNKGNANQINMMWWWYVSWIYWMIAGAVILINMLIALMSDSISRIQAKSKIICMYNTMIFLAEMEALFPKYIAKVLSNFVTCKGDVMKRIVLEIPLEEEIDAVDELALCKGSFEDFKNYLNFTLDSIEKI